MNNVHEVYTSFHLTAFCNSGERNAWREKFLTDADRIHPGRFEMNFNWRQFYPYVKLEYTHFLSLCPLYLI